MCFYTDDCDWTASVYDDEVGVVTEEEAATHPIKCGECRRVIAVGSWRRHIFMQEHEWCRHDPGSDDYDGPEADDDEAGCPEGCSHDYGESFAYDRCEACEQLIEAIHQHELSVGCREYESRPALEDLYEEMRQGEGKVYLAKAEELFPGITSRLPADLMWFRDDDEEAEAEEEGDES